ncbi:hypothetical protein MTO96_001214 [Rhipicephalus appendiculatus]
MPQTKRSLRSESSWSPKAQKSKESPKEPESPTKRPAPSPPPLPRAAEEPPPSAEETPEPKLVPKGFQTIVIKQEPKNKPVMARLVSSSQQVVCNLVGGQPTACPSHTEFAISAGSPSDHRRPAGTPGYCHTHAAGNTAYRRPGQPEQWASQVKPRVHDGCRGAPCSHGGWWPATEGHQGDPRASTWCQAFAGTPHRACRTQGSPAFIITHRPGATS